MIELQLTSYRVHGAPTSTSLKQEQMVTPLELDMCSLQDLETFTPHGDLSHHCTQSRVFSQIKPLENPVEC